MSSRQALTGSPARRSPGGSGREAQRRRTRNAIVAATRELMAAGQTPSVDDIAATAEVSRRTIYLYFPTLDQLLLDAAAGLLSDATVDAELEHRGHDVLARADALAKALLELAPDALPLGRKILALTVDRDPPPAGGGRRGHRRVEWIERAVEPLKSQLTKRQFERLVSSLSIVLGWEALIVLRDVRGLDRAREAEALRWTTRAVVLAALAEVDERIANKSGRRKVTS